MTQYYFHDGHQEQGPFGIEQLKSQSLTSATPIWYEGLEKWTTAGEVSALTHLFGVKLTPPPLYNPHTENRTSPKIEQKSSFPIPDIVPTVKKKKSTIAIIVASILVIGSIAGWVIYQNSESDETIYSLQEQVNTQQVVLSDQENAETERQRINTAITAKNMNFRNNWVNYIKAQNSEPSIDFTFGGISEFNIFVSNETSYMLDEVDIYVEYIRKNGNVYQTKTVKIFNVPAGSSESGVAPSSINGVRVNCIIEKIVSKKMHFCYPEDNGNSQDPYFCK